MEAVASVLSRLMQKLGLSAELEGWRAVEEWHRLVGPRVGRHTRAVSFRNGALLVEVEGSAWMHELSFLKRDLIQRVNRYLGADRVREVKLILARGGIRR
jgi:predicted nucleic acid-binding Zn ribbon protein